MSLGVMNKSASILRRISYNNDVVLVDDGDHGFLFVGLTPSTDLATLGGEPRDLPSATLRHSSGLLGPSAPLRAGERLEVDGVAWELIDDGKQIRSGGRSIVMEYRALKVDDLFPLTGDLTEMGGAPVDQIRFSAWAASEETNERGVYDDYDAEAPAEFMSALKRNRVITTASARYKITSTAPDLSPPRVRMRLRRTDG